MPDLKSVNKSQIAGQHMNKKNSVILVGMPGAGKSTLGVMLAKELGPDFLVTDVSIQVHEGRTLLVIMDSEGYMKLREIV